MTRRANRLLLLALAVVSLTLYYGCSQSDDIVTPVSTSVLTLDASRLPTLPEGMVYELWAANDDDIVSIGRFGYDQENWNFLTESGQIRPEGRAFKMSGDILSFEIIFISVENAGLEDEDPELPANMMLLDLATDPRDNHIELVLPLYDSTFRAAPYFCMQTPSDNNREMASIDAGIWFAQYLLERVNIVEEIGIDSVVYETIIVQTKDSVVTTDYILNLQNPLLTIYRYFAFDTLAYRQANYVKETLIVTDVPASVRAAEPYFEYGETINRLFDNFTQGEGYAMVDYSMFGFKYRGWVMAPAVQAANASVGEWTPPVWYYGNSFNIFVDPANCGLISTGTFGSIEAADDANPYSAGQRVPKFPGEDFLVNLPNGASGPLNLIAEPGGPYLGAGNVFISLEPMNYKDSTTNFPIILFTARLPFSKSALFPDTTQNNPPPRFFEMRNFSSPDYDLGTPKVTVGIDRY